jgi:exopolysaccharide production protein ExoQ
LSAVQTLPAPDTKAPTAATKSDKPSRWLWVPLIWLFFASTRQLSTWMAWDRPTATNADLGGSPVERLLMTSLIVLGLYVLHLRWSKAKKILANNKWIVLLFVYMALSIIWSNFPGITARRWIRSAGNLEMVLVVLTERNPLEAVRVLLRRLYLFITPLSAYAVKYMRNIGVVYNWDGVEEQWVGLSTDKNSLGQVTMVSGLFQLWSILRDWPQRKSKRVFRRILLHGAVLAVAMWLLKGSKNSHSSSSILGFITCTAVLIALQMIRKRSARAKNIILGCVVATVVLAPIGSMVFEALDITPVKVVLQATGRDMTLTDRTLIWTDVLNNAAKHPILGVGMGAYWVGPIGYDLYPMPNWSAKTPEWRPEEGHNGYIDIYAQLGIVGEVIMLGIIVTAIAGALHHLQTDFQFGSLRLVVLLGILMNNFTETSFLSGTHDFWFLFLMFAINLPRPPKRRIAKRMFVDSAELNEANEQRGLALGMNATMSLPVLAAR